MIGVRLAHKLRVDRRDPSVVTPSTQLVGMAPLHLTTMEKEARRRVWAMILRVDTYSTMGSGLAPLIYEGFVCEYSIALSYTFTAHACPPLS